MSMARTLIPLACTGALCSPSAAAAQDAAPAPAPQPTPEASLSGQPTVQAQMAKARRHAQRRTLARRVRRLEIRLARLTGERAPRRRSLTALASFERWQLRKRIRRLSRSIRRERVYSSVALPPALRAIAMCESGGNPRAIGGGGRYRGKYQFDFRTWASVGGKGDPAAAPEREQDMRAAILYRRAGASPWPVCGR